MPREPTAKTCIATIRAKIYAKDWEGSHLPVSNGKVSG
jgi:hypothetical protein